MSAYGRQMERQSSAQSLSSRGSERGSGYIVETGIYMSSSAAAVFIAGLVTVGVTLMALLISLTVMLRLCQTRNAGIVEFPKSVYDYDYCKIVALDMELNNLDVESIPVVCKDVLIEYIRGGRYMKDLSSTIGIAEKYFSDTRPVDVGKDVVLMDADDFFPSNSSNYLIPHRFNQFDCSNCIGGAKYLKHKYVQKLYLKIRDEGWPLILLSRRPMRLRNSTEEYLISAGCDGFSSLVMRAEDELQLHTQEYFSRQSMKLRSEGFHIVAVISSQMDALRGQCLGSRIFKLPNAYFIDRVEDHFEA